METTQNPTTDQPASTEPAAGEVQGVIASLPVHEQTQALFDSIAKERIDLRESADETARLKTFFTALLWIGYGVALVVAIILVGSAVSSLLRTIPR